MLAGAKFQISRGFTKKVPAHPWNTLPDISMIS
jgi:hypothetical protein